VNWRESEGIVYPTTNNNIVHDGTSIQWDPISNIWSGSVTPVDPTNNENFEESFIRYRLNRQPSNNNPYISSKLKDNQTTFDDNEAFPQYEEPSSSTAQQNINQQDSPIKNTDNTFLLNSRLQQLNQQFQQQQNHNKQSGINPNDSFNLMNNTNVWGNGSESDANNISLNFDIPNQIFNTGTEDVFNQTDVWDSKSTKSATFNK